MRADDPTMIVHGDGPPVVLVHGLAGFKEAWGDLPRALAAAGMRAVAVDLPGAVGRAPRGPCDATAHTVALARLLDRLGPGVALVGHSLGAQVVLRLARARPGTIRAVALLAPVVVPRPRTRRRPRGPADLLRVPLVGPPLARLAIAVARRDPRRRRAAFLRVAGGGRRPAPGSEQARLVDEAARRLARVDLRAFTGWAASAVRDGALADAAAVTAPALVVAGARDPVAPPSEAHLLAGLMGGGARTLVIAGVGHLPHLEGGLAAVATIVDHLRCAGAASSDG